MADKTMSGENFVLEEVAAAIDAPTGASRPPRIFVSQTAVRDAINRLLQQTAEADRDILVCCSDSHSSVALGDFAASRPAQSIETGIAEQTLVGLAAGLAIAGKKPIAVAPAAFLSTRAYEQIKIDVAYNAANVKILAFGGGISYGPLGLSHHAPNDIAAMCALPDLRVYLPSDAAQTEVLLERLLKDNQPAYIRYGLSPVPDIYRLDKLKENFSLNEAIYFGDSQPELLLVACGETVSGALSAMTMLRANGVRCGLLDMFCLKPFDSDALIYYAKSTRAVITVEEHSPYGGLGAITAQTLAAVCPKPLISLSLPDAPALCGTSAEVFAEYHLDAAGIIRAAKRALT